MTARNRISQSLPDDIGRQLKILQILFKKPVVRERSSFCQRLDAELVAIAGLYQTSETLGPAPGEGGVQIFLKDDRLQKEALG